LPTDRDCAGVGTRDDPHIGDVACGALQAAQTTFALVTAKPTNLYLNGDDFGDDLPPGRIGLGRLRDLLPFAILLSRLRRAPMGRCRYRAPLQTGMMQ
jgi:hypothetical protein